MREAFREGYIGYKISEIPVGAVIVKDRKILSKAHNLRETRKISIYHAEVLVIEKACKKLKRWRLDDCDIYVTLEPCIMCLGAIIESRIKRLYFGSYDLENGAISSLKILDLKNFKLNARGGFLEEKCLQIIRRFFREIRKNEH
jgi:tRNA(adenine34) deaminase